MYVPSRIEWAIDDLWEQKYAKEIFTLVVRAISPGEEWEPVGENPDLFSVAKVEE